jgi:hypothetical protein
LRRRLNPMLGEYVTGPVPVVLKGLRLEATKIPHVVPTGMTVVVAVLLTPIMRGVKLSRILVNGNYWKVWSKSFLVVMVVAAKEATELNAEDVRAMDTSVEITGTTGPRVQDRDETTVAEITIPAAAIAAAAITAAEHEASYSIAKSFHCKAEEVI